MGNSLKEKINSVTNKKVDGEWIVKELRRDVQEAVNDFHFLEWTIIRYKIGKPYDLEKLKNICNKYNMLMSRVLEEDYGTTEMHKIIFGDWEEKEE